MPTFLSGESDFRSALDDYQERRELQGLGDSDGLGSDPTLEPPSLAQRPHGRHDHAERKRALRKGRERGCSLYITAGALERAGFDPLGDPPFYRTWASPRGRIVVQLYREK